MSRVSLFPALSPFSSGMLPVSAGHRIYYEVSGNPDGIPVVILHGGPGAGSNPTMRRYHNPERYRIVLFDQRGCGRSEPYASLAANTTWDLVDDIERLRNHLAIDAWQVFGGSWGSTLALAYAETHPDRVTDLILRGIFFCSRQEIDWFYGRGTGVLFPEAYEKFLAPLDPADRQDPIPAYHRLLSVASDPATSRSETARVEHAARAWSQWEASTLSLMPNPERVQAFGSARYAVAFARIECHYFMNEGFFAEGRGVLENVNRIAHLPVTIVNGRYDVVTPVRSAWDLHRALPQSNLVIVPDAGHAMTEPGLIDALVRATERSTGSSD
ncbi:MAG: prolyl aminopeptidase [Pseudomonadota bacterium]